MLIAIVRVENNRIAKFAEFQDMPAAQAHCEEHGGFVYEGDYSPELWVDGESVSIVPITSLTEKKDKFSSDIDDLVAAIYNRFTRFESEYTLREAQAQAYKDAGYTGTVPQQVAAFATPAGMDAETATDLILSQAANLRAALAMLGAKRMRKYEIINAEDAEAAQAKFDEISAEINAIGDSLS